MVAHMLSIRVADEGVILIGLVINGMREWLKMMSTNSFEAG